MARRSARRSSAGASSTARRGGSGRSGGAEGPFGSSRSDTSSSRSLGASLGKVMTCAPSRSRSRAGVTCEGDPRAPVPGREDPATGGPRRRVRRERGDQRQLLGPLEPLQRRLAPQRRPLVFGALLVHEVHGKTGTCVACTVPHRMAFEAPGEIVRGARVQRSVAAAEDVDAPGCGSSHGGENTSPGPRARCRGRGLHLRSAARVRHGGLLMEVVLRWLVGRARAIS